MQVVDIVAQAVQMQAAVTLQKSFVGWIEGLLGGWGSDSWDGVGLTAGVRLAVCLGMWFVL